MVCFSRFIDLSIDVEGPLIIDIAAVFSYSGHCVVDVEGPLIIDVVDVNQSQASAHETSYQYQAWNGYYRSIIGR